jgi:hypothetical protein
MRKVQKGKFAAPQTMAEGDGNFKFDAEITGPVKGFA